jgi:uncharacterized LabA/DUF88 family protein
MDYYPGAAGQLFERVMVFLDAGYLQACIRDHYENRPLDLTKFAGKLVGQRRLVRTYYYTAKIERPPDDYWRNQQREQQRYMDALAYLPAIEVRWGRLQFGDGGTPRQKGVDVLLALDMLRFALKNNYDTAILVSGDGDFADIVRMVKDEGRKVELVTFPRTRARALLEAADVCYEVTLEMLEGCWLAGTREEDG